MGKHQEQLQRKGVIEMKKLCLFSLILCLFLGVPSCKKNKDEQKTTMKEKVEKKAQDSRMVESKDATLKIVEGAGNTVGIDLANNVPVRGVQFAIEGVQMTEVRTTSRTAGFLADFNKESGIVIMASTSGDNIAPGTGLIAEIICDKGGSASLSGIKIAK
jgi:hypothetical protein